MFSNENLITIFIMLNTVLCTSVKETELLNEPLHRSRRQLLWPNSTLLQFNAGFGFPSAAKNINVNYAFQANFQLPWNRSQIPIDILEANSGYTGYSRKKRETIREDGNEHYQDDARLYHFYKHIEDVLDSFGYNGKACMLQTLCQLGSEPLHSDDEEDLLHEMVSYVLNPTNDVKHTLKEDDESYPYIKAYKDGQNLQPCIKLYGECSQSLIDLFTRLHDKS